MYLEMIEEIRTEIDRVLSENGVELTDQHRLWAIEGLIDGWEELEDEDGDNPLYHKFVTAAKLERTMLRMGLLWEW